ncbi:hypothetical protein QCE62_00530 [Caballeronia sp. LZ033]|uniref:hypothetical protein n=1 Tax=Caballeronia sp. LZ033 TaxID=3038566 RepID=UPI002861E8F8|nr:hypothetical protein [Caballeronia sp. LZ033]MDR5812072.1 hypothetical protein [Caballeronia sp. LZ033]
MRIEQGGEVFELSQGENEVEVSEGVILCSIEALSRPVVVLNEQRMLISWNRVAKLAVWSVDLTNQVGFHRLLVQLEGKRYNFDFRTRTAKATWAEVRSMAEFCSSSYFGYRRQFTYMAADGTTRKVRLPQVHYAWLRERIPEVEQLVRSIQTRPATSSFKTHQSSLRSKGLSVSRTSRLLRENHRLLELDDTGPINVGKQRYWPSRLVVSAKERHSQLDEHAQIAAFLWLLAAECDDLASVVASIRSEVQQFRERIHALRALALFSGVLIRPNARPISVMATHIQRTDQRYGRLRDLQAEYGSGISDSMEYARSIRVNVRDVWEIYQTFVAHIIGNALGLSYSSEDRDLRKRSPQGWSMASDDWRMYFDTKPPKMELPSWRDATNRPADERPDIILIGKRAGEVILLDAKFKLDSMSSRAQQVDLFEMQGYLNSFATNHGGILYPGPKLAANIIAAKGNVLIELPIRAAHIEEPGGLDAAHQYIRDALQSVHGTTRS